MLRQFLFKADPMRGPEPRMMPGAGLRRVSNDLQRCIFALCIDALRARHARARWSMGLIVAAH